LASLFRGKYLVDNIENYLFTAVVNGNLATIRPLAERAQSLGINLSNLFLYCITYNERPAATILLSYTTITDALMLEAAEIAVKKFQSGNLQLLLSHPNFPNVLGTIALRNTATSFKCKSMLGLFLRGVYISPPLPDTEKRGWGPKMSKFAKFC